MNEDKHERFMRIVEKRMTLIISDFKKLGNCSTRTSYDYTDDEVTKIFSELDHQIACLKERFAGKKSFSLDSDDAGTQDQASTKSPLIEIDAGFGTILVNVATDPAYPGLYLDFKQNSTEYAEQILLLESQALKQDNPSNKLRLLVWQNGDGADPTHDIDLFPTKPDLGV